MTHNPFAEPATDSSELVDASELDFGEAAEEDFDAQWDAMAALRHRKSQIEYRRRLGLGFSLAAGVMAIGSVLTLTNPACSSNRDCNQTMHLALGGAAGVVALGFGGTGTYLLLDSRKRRREYEAMRMGFVIAPDGSWAVSIGGRFGG